MEVKAIGNRLRSLRRSEKGLTQIALAEEWELSQGFISAIENGSSVPTIELLERYSARYGVSYDWLITGRDAPEKTKQLSNEEILLQAIGRDDLKTMFKNTLRPEIQEEFDEYHRTLSQEDSQLISTYRRAPPVIQGAIMDLLSIYKKPEGSQKNGTEG